MAEFHDLDRDGRDDVLAALALGALHGAERAHAEAWIAQDPVARCRYEELRTQVELLPYALPRATPPPHLRDAVIAHALRGAARRDVLPSGDVLASDVMPSKVAPSGGVPTDVGDGEAREREQDLRLRQEAAATQPPRALRADERAQPPRPLLAPASPAPRPIAWHVVALAAAVVALLAYGLWNSVGRGPRESRVDSLIANLPEGSVRALDGTGDPDADARLFVERDGHAQLFVTGLSPLAAGRTYQLWFKGGDGVIVSGGTFTVDARGDGHHVLTMPGPLDHMHAIAVTEEAAPGVAQPTGIHLVDLRL